MNAVGSSWYFHSIFTQVNIHKSDANHPGMAIMSLRLCEIWWDGWIKMVDSFFEAFAHEHLSCLSYTVLFQATKVRPGLI